jgi:hypothetical protein
VCANDREKQVFVTMKVFILQEITITFQVSGDEMPLYFDMQSNCTIDGGDTTSVGIKI